MLDFISNYKFIQKREAYKHYIDKTQQDSKKDGLTFNVPYAYSFILNATNGYKRDQKPELRESSQYTQYTDPSLSYGLNENQYIPQNINYRVDMENVSNAINSKLDETTSNDDKKSEMLHGNKYNINILTDSEHNGSYGNPLDYTNEINSLFPKVGPKQDHGLLNGNYEQGLQDIDNGPVVNLINTDATQSTGRFIHTEKKIIGDNDGTRQTNGYLVKEAKYSTDRENVRNDSDPYTLSKSNTVNPVSSEIINIDATNSRSGFGPKSKTESFSSANEDMQVNQQTLVNPCFYHPQTISPYRLGSSLDGSQLLKIVPVNNPKIPQYILNPPMYPYMPPFIQNPYYSHTFGIPIQQFHQEQQTTPLQVISPAGQYYLCNPVSPPINNIATFPGIEVRREAFNLQDIMQTIKKPTQSSNQSRAAINNCPSKQHSCADGSRCISNQHVCDNEVHCDDGSDEMFCSCKDRVGKIRTCDGYPDCPNSEDERGCFGCTENEFSCDDWSKFRKSTCIPIEQRCDNVKQCEITGKDEEDCAILTDYMGSQPQFKISNAIGFLYRNYRGKWYPICMGSETWAKEVCKMESGPSVINPRIHMMVTNYHYIDYFIDIFPNNDVRFVKTCVQNRATFVECPPLYCGLRMVVKNPYRAHEIDTSIEDVINELQRFSGNSVKTNILNNSTKEEIEELSESRVVGGNPSQPAAWPWLVSIYKNGIFHCGGILIDDLWVVTAAHCVDRYWQHFYDIQAGMLRRFSYSPMEQRRWAVVIKPHENYDRGSLRNDIALIKLSSPVRYNRYVRPICLPSEATAGHDFLRGPLPGTICTTAGWGATVEHGSDPDHMREVEIPVLENCRNNEDLVGDEICAGLSEGGKDACQGDSGGPLMCRNPNNPSQWYLAGIVSHGEGCARPNEPGVYTKVSKFVGWITENIRNGKFQHRAPLEKCPGYICSGIKICLPIRRRCDNIVDCLLGDDEKGCKNHIHDIFKHVSRTYLVGSSLKGEDKNVAYNSSLAPSTLSSIIMDKIDTALKHPETNLSTIIYNTMMSNQNVTFAVEKQIYFKCKRMLQLIPKRKRCDKIIDCEDGTDEVDCLCSDYLRKYNVKAICDGITDCNDTSDEINCVHCQPSDYYCRRSKQCIDFSKQCDTVKDCSKYEDEEDCAALTDGTTLTLDSDLRPKLGMSGIITINRFGVWRPLCVNTSDNEASIATNVCNLLGFEEYIGYHKYQVKDKPVNVTIEGFKQANYTNETSNICSGLFVRCSNVSWDNSVHNIYQDNITEGGKLYISPWSALIHSDGVYTCMGIILSMHWIVTSANCFNGLITLNLNYVIALLGKGTTQLPVTGPHEQILRVTQSVAVRRSDLILLYLEETIKFSRYIQPININARKITSHKEKCVALGLTGNNVEYTYLRATEICPVGYKCYTPMELTRSKEHASCQVSSPSSGAILCNSGNGWYPSSVFYENNVQCGSSFVKKYTSIQFFKYEILKAMNTEQVQNKANLPSCQGFRCKIGECIPYNKICNGIPDCRSGEDEQHDLCFNKIKDCHRSGTCECPSTHLKCSNEKCIWKTSFCNRINDCDDYGDEPDSCSCKNYLLLSNATKICDGIIHCMDRTDEDPKLCSCESRKIKCGNSSYCVTSDMLCDGFKDCPNGEDETDCISLKSEGKRSTAGEVLKRTAGIWHSGCFKSNYSAVELEQICERLGLPSKNVTQRNPFPSTTKTTLRPRIDDFSVIWIHKVPGNKLQLRIRTGFEPYVRFVPDHNCYRLFINCT